MVAKFLIQWMIIFFSLSFCASLDNPNCEIIRPSTDKSICTVEKHGNFTVIHIRDKQCSKFAAAFSVNVGFTNDPINIQGLSNLVKHLVFSQNNVSFEKYVNGDKGSIGGITTVDSTIYYFDVSTKFATEVVDKFTGVFRNKLLININNTALNKAIQNIETIYRNNRFNREYTNYLLFVDMMKSDAKLKNTVGMGHNRIFNNLERQVLIDAIINLVENDYRKAKKTLVIWSNKDLKYSKSIAQKFLNIYKPSSVVESSLDTTNTGLPSDIKNLTAELFCEDVLSRIVYRKPAGILKNNVVVKMVTIIPDNNKYLGINPMKYIKIIFQNLKWGDGFPNPIQFNLMKYIDYMFVEVETVLNNSDDVKPFLSKVHSHINSLKANKYEYEYIKNLTQAKYKYKKQIAPIEMVFKMAENSMHYNLSHVVCTDEILGEFDADIINSYISIIGDFKNWIILVEDPSVDLKKKGQVVTEKFDQIKYVIDEKLSISSDTGDNINDTGDIRNDTRIDIRNDTRADTKNNTRTGTKNNTRYDSVTIASSGITKRVFNEKSSLTRTLEDDGELNFVFEVGFKTDRVRMEIVLISDDIYKKSVEYYIYFGIIEKKLRYFYQKSIEDNNVDLDLSLNEEGIVMSIEGSLIDVNKALEVFFKYINNDSILDEASDMGLKPEEGRILLNGWFDELKGTVRSYCEEIIYDKPRERINEKFREAVVGGVSAEERLEVINKIALGDIKIERKLFIRMAAIGNARYEEIVGIFNMIRTKLGCKNVYHGIKAVDKPTLVEFKTYDKENNAVSLLYEVNKYRNEIEDPMAEFNYIFDIQREKRTAISLLITRILRSGISNNDRNKTKLGRLISVKLIRVRSAQYISFTIQSSENRSLIKQSILTFVEGIRNLIDGISDDEFQVFKDGAANKYLAPLDSMKTFCSWIIDSRMEGYIDLNKRKRISEIIRGLSKHDLVTADFFSSFTEVMSVNYIKKSYSVKLRFR